MDKEKFYSLAEQIRNELHEIVDAQIDDLIQRIENPGRISTNERLCSFAMPSSYFKGKKPSVVVFSNGERIPVHTWRETAEVIFKDCNADEKMHQRLLDISGKVLGRNRVILGTTDSGMRSPVKIDSGIYFESYFDTEALMKMMKERVLDVVGYDYGGIKLGVYEPKMQREVMYDSAFNESDGEDETESDGFNMTM